MMIGKVLKDLRSEKGVNLVDASSAIGISKSSLGAYETDKRFPSDDVLDKLADYYGTSVDVLLMSGESEKRGELGRDANFEQRFCPLRIKAIAGCVEGESVKLFMPCVGNKCMAYKKGVCGMFDK